MIEIRKIIGYNFPVLRRVEIFICSKNFVKFCEILQKILKKILKKISKVFGFQDILFIYFQHYEKKKKWAKTHVRYSCAKIVQKLVKMVKMETIKC